MDAVSVLYDGKLEVTPSARIMGVVVLTFSTGTALALRERLKWLCAILAGDWVKKPTTKTGRANKSRGTNLEGTIFTSPRLAKYQKKCIYDKECIYWIR